MPAGWYPGHMPSAISAIKRNSGLVDVVLEIADARLPATSRNPRLEFILGEKPWILILNKADLADRGLTDGWAAHFRKGGLQVCAVSALGGSGIRAVRHAITGFRDRRIPGRQPRAMVVGLPNVGKSTLINRLARRAAARTGGVPGITRGAHWVVGEGFELLDLPGVLPPGTRAEPIKLGLAGIIPDESYDPVEAASWLIELMIREGHAAALAERYRCPEPDSSHELLAAIARARGYLKPGGSPEPEKAATAVIRDYRECKLGRVSLEAPPPAAGFGDRGGEDVRHGFQAHGPQSDP